MYTATHAASFPERSASGTADADVVQTRLWIEEHDWLYALLRSEHNEAPTFRFPDLLSACIALVFSRDDAAERIFGFLGTTLVLRAPDTPRRRELFWRPQYELLHDLQCSPANQHPNPKFGLDQLTTACVALCRQDDESGAAVLRQARLNMVQRHLAASGAP
jgi:hypothetical protein